MDFAWTETTPIWSSRRARHRLWEGITLGLEVLEGCVVFAEHLLEVRESALADVLVARALAVEVPDDDDLRLVGHRDVGVGLLRALRWTFQDLQLEPERRGPLPLSHLPRPALPPRRPRPHLQPFSPS